MINKDLLEYDIALILLVVFFAVVLPIFFISAKIYVGGEYLANSFQYSIILPPAVFLLIGCPLAFIESKKYRETRDSRDLENTIHRLWKTFFALAAVVVSALILIWLPHLPFF
ncbi:MAG: hypothetical protein GF334_11685 [Candidatus Altiarchaeales archaeon]|nr:hypothetical protein [Candidatus Altiarchaeales archaeon]